MMLALDMLLGAMRANDAIDVQKLHVDRVPSIAHARFVAWSSTDSRSELQSIDGTFAVCISGVPARERGLAE